jgi:peptide-methionine (S)-S-oxide reductase
MAFLKPKPVIAGTSLLISPDQFPQPALDEPRAASPSLRQAVLAGGCFWCVEAVYRQLDGVLDVKPGYAGGSADTANYRRVCDGDTGHAEVIRVAYDPAKVTFGQLLRVFFSVAHDPTQLNRQGPDTGTQYRSAIFFDGDEQRRVAEAYVAQLTADKAFNVPVVTQITRLEQFFEAEEYHHDYAARNPQQPFIAGVSTPKVEEEVAAPTVVVAGDKSKAKPKKTEKQNQK